MGGVCVKLTKLHAKRDADGNSWQFKLGFDACSAELLPLLEQALAAMGQVKLHLGNDENCNAVVYINETIARVRGKLL
jgi:hypothetical protein